MHSYAFLSPVLFDYGGQKLFRGPFMWANKKYFILYESYYSGKLQLSTLANLLNITVLKLEDNTFLTRDEVSDRK